MRKERQAQQAHPKLYALGQHSPIRLLGRLVWNRKALKAAGKRRRHAPYVQHSVYRSQPPRTVVVHVYAGATVNLTNV